MATRHQHRTSIALTLAAAILIAAGGIWGPGLADWITGQPEIAPVDRVEDTTPGELAADWADTLGVVDLDQPVEWSRNGLALSVDRLFITDADTFRAVVRAAEQPGEAAQPGYLDFGTGPVTADDDLAAYGGFETVIGLRYTMANNTGQPVSWAPGAGMTTLQFPGQPGAVGPRAVYVPHAGHLSGVFDEFSGTYQGWALYQTDSSTLDQLRAIGELEWRAGPASGPAVDYPHGTDDEYPADWPRLTLTYQY